MGINKVYRQLNMSSVPAEAGEFLVNYAVSSACAALDIPWEDGVRALVRQAHELCLMPDNRKCINGMMRDLGFFLQPGIRKEYYPISRLCEDMPEKYGSDAVAVVIGRNAQVCAHAFAIMPDDDGKFYAYYPMASDNLLELERHASQVWVRWPDGEDHSPKARKSGGRKSSGKASGAGEGSGDGGENQIKHAGDSEYFHFANKNPAGNFTGDCVVRGVASALDVSWHEALDELVRAGEYRFPMVNTDIIFPELMKNRGCIRCMPAGKRGIKASAICEMLDKSCPEGTRALVHFGKHHVAAIVPVDCGDGRVRHKVEDTWNSSFRLVSEFWICEGLR